jgi:uncharacterized membrane protein
MDVQVTATRPSALFLVSMWWRVIYGIFKFFLGLYLIQHIGDVYSQLLPPFLAAELAVDPHERFVQGIYGAVRIHEQVISYFVSIYFIFWGAMDVFLTYCLLKRVVWAFPLSIALLGAFVLYEMVRVTHTHSLILAWIICVDIFIMYLVYVEYKKLKHTKE